MRRSIRALAATAVLLVLLCGAAFGQGYGGSDGHSSSQTRPRIGEQFRVTFHGFRPLSRVTLFLFSDPVRLGEFDADAKGEVTADITLPPTTPIGKHHIVADGLGATGEAIRGQIAVTVQDATPSAIAFTGSNASNLLALSGVLIMVGLAGMFAARRRLEPGAAPR